MRYETKMELISSFRKMQVNYKNQLCRNVSSCDILVGVGDKIHLLQGQHKEKAHGLGTL